MISGEWTDPERGKIKLGDYAETWITERPGLRPRTIDLYRWLLKKHIAPYLGGVPVGKMSARLVRRPAIGYQPSSTSSCSSAAGALLGR